MSRIFSLIFLLLFPAFSPLFAADDIYLVENLPINITAKTPAAASSAAALKVNREAFIILLSRLQMSEELAMKVSDEEISDMIRSQHIDEEKIAGNTYSGTFSISFAKDFVDHILSKKLQADSFLTADANVNEKPFLLVPIKVVGANNVVWQGNNWRDIFAKTIINNPKKFILLENNLENVSLINGEGVDSLSYDSVANLLSRHNASAIYLLFFNFDHNNDRLNVDLESLGRVEKKRVRLNFSNISSIDKKELDQIVATKVLNYLNNVKVNDKAVSGPINLEVKVRNLGNWLMMKNKIENSGLVNQVSVKAISRNYALLKLNYIGNSDVTSSFAQKGIAVQHQGENNYIIPVN